MGRSAHQRKEIIMSIDRRVFLKSSIASGFALGFPGVVGAQRDKTYRTALIGCGWWGTNILREAAASGRCKIVAMVDVDRRQIEKCAAEVAKWVSDTPKHYEDYREMLEKEKPEIVIVGTPDHWHALPTIAAVKAGAHVYVEKPISHTIREGRAMVKAAREANRVVQVGTHRRVSPHNVSGRKFLREGNAGKIAMVRCFVLYGGDGPEQPRQNVEPPKELNWDLWCGPAPMRPYNGDTGRGGGIHPRGFRSYLDYANGTLGDWGVHWLDQVHWIMERRSPKTVYSTGGRLIKGKPLLTDQEQTTDAPDHQVATYEFDDLTVTWEHRQFAGNPAEKTESVGCFFYGTKGTFHMGWQQGWTFYPLGRGGQEIHEEPKLNQPDGQNIKELWADFLDAIETHRKPISDIEEVHYSTALSLLGMLSYKLGRSVRWDGEKEVCIGDPQANTMLRREYRKPWVYPEA
jgi:predicted dehydrogenase